MTHLLNNIYCVELPEGASDIDYENGFIYYEMPDKLLEKSIAIPGYNYSILFTRDNQTEEGWKGVVEGISPFEKRIVYRDYNGSADEWLDMSDWFDTPTQSGHSLLQSKNINPENNWVIISKQ